MGIIVSAVGVVVRVMAFRWIFFFMGCSIAGVVAVILFVVLMLALFIQIGGSGYRGLFGFAP